MFGLTKKELKILRSLSTPEKVQDFLDRLPINFERSGETLMSPRRVLRERRAHCMEAALLAATAFWLKGEKPLLLDLKTDPEDDEHVVALFQVHGYWGAVSKTNHATLRYRDPVYKTVRELAMSYFHEYFLNKNGKKTLRSFSRPYNLRTLGTDWITTEEDLWHIAKELDRIPHFPVVPLSNRRRVRPAGTIERRAGKLTEWKKPKGSG